MEEFQPVQLPELLVITGRACTRILSGYQKTKKEEETILANLREEGLLAKPGGKGQGAGGRGQGQEPYTLQNQSRAIGQRAS